MMTKEEIRRAVKNEFERNGGDLSITYDKYSEDLSPSDIYNIILGKDFEYRCNVENIYIEDMEKPKTIKRSVYIGEDKPKKEEPKELPKEDGNGKRVNPFKTDMEVISEVFEEEYPKPNTTPFQPEITIESVGFAIAFKNLKGKGLIDLFKPNDPIELIPALRACYKNTPNDSIRERISEIVLELVLEL